MFRSSLGLDIRLPWNMALTLEGTYTKTLNNILVKSVNIKPSIETLEGADNRPIFNRRDLIDDTYGNIVLVSNTSEGYTYNFTAQLQKAFYKGFTGNIAYSFTKAENVFDGTSSINHSQWRGLHSVQGRNNASLQRSDFDAGSRIIAFLSYKKEYLNSTATTISLFFEGTDGDPFSYIYNDAGNITNEDSRERTLIYVPSHESEITFGERR